MVSYATRRAVTIQTAEGRALPYVTAALGHSSPTTTLNHYAHVFDEARLGPGVQFVDAIRAARRTWSVRVCTQCVLATRCGP